MHRDVYEGVLSHYVKLFTDMEDEGILDPLNEIHSSSLHYVMSPEFNERSMNLKLHVTLLARSQTSVQNSCSLKELLTVPPMKKQKMMVSQGTTKCLELELTQTLTLLWK